MAAAPPAAEAAAQKLQLLADALALEFSQSLASAQCSNALRRLLPGLEYLSIGLSNPAQGGGIVASANCAAEGPTTLHLHDPLACAAGLALARGQPLQTSLLGADPAAGGTKLLLAWTDVQQMVLAAPAVTHLLCMPFGILPAADEAAAAAGPACGAHSGSGKGALLFGFSAPPSLDARRSAALAMLAEFLPAAMAAMSADTLAFVNFACGSKAQCSCCCEASGDGEEEEEEEAGAGGPCSDSDHGGDDRDTAPGQALRVPRGAAASAGEEEEEEEQAAVFDRPGPSGWHAVGDEGKRSGKTAPAAAMAEAAGLQAMGASRASYLPTGRPAPSLSKALVAAAGGEEGEAAMQQSPLTLTFRSALMEQEFGRWIAQYHLKVDILFSLLLLSALIIISFLRPYCLLENAPGRMLLGVGMAAPLALIFLSRSLYASWREQLVVALRLYVVAFINFVSIRTYQSHLPPERTQQWLTFWMLTGAESLCVTSLGFPIRMQLHLPLQFATMGLAAWNLPRMCAECYPGAASGSCFRSGALMAAAFGFVLPTAGLRFIEQRSRNLFCNLLRTAAASSN